MWCWSAQRMEMPPIHPFIDTHIIDGLVVCRQPLFKPEAHGQGLPHISDQGMPSVCITGRVVSVLRPRLVRMQVCASTVDHHGDLRVLQDGRLAEQGSFAATRRERIGEPPIQQHAVPTTPATSGAYTHALSFWPGLDSEARPPPRRQVNLRLSLKQFDVQRTQCYNPDERDFLTGALDLLAVCNRDLPCQLLFGATRSFHKYTAGTTLRHAATCHAMPFHKTLQLSLIQRNPYSC